MMMASPHILARDEQARLRALEHYYAPGQIAASSAANGSAVNGMGFIPDDPALDDLVQLAADLCATPMAGIALLTRETILFVARVGSTLRSIPRASSLIHSPYELALRDGDLFEVRDARYHPDFRPDGILVAGRVFRFFAGVPLITPQGTTIGCLFVQSSQPQSLTTKQKSALTTLGHQVITHLELKSRRRTADFGSRDLSRVETALTVERNFVSTVLDTVGALVAVFDTAGRIVRFNRTCEDVSGYAFSQLVGTFFWDSLIPEEDVDEAIEDFARLRAGEFPASFENYWQHHDGSLRRIAWSATALLDDQAQPTFLIATGIDVTEQRAAEATLQESEARYRQLVEGSLGIICTHALDGTILSINANGAGTLGRSVEEMLGAPLTAFMPPHQLSSFDRYIQQITRTGEAQGRLEFYTQNPVRSPADIRTVAFRNKLIADDSGKEPYILAFGVDISEQVRAEQKLRALSHQSNSILESIGDGIYGIDLNGNVTVINPAAAQMLGYKPAEVLGRNLHQLVHHSFPDGSPYPEALCAISQAAVTAATVRIANEVFWRKDGSSFPVEYVARPQLDPTSTPAKPKPVGVVVAFRDTTERRALDRMKDEFISTVSHELRTPLTSLRAALGLVRGGALDKRPEKKQQMLEIALGNTDRLIKLVNDFLDIERISSGNAELHSQLVSAQSLFDRATSLQQAAADKFDIRFDIQHNNVQVYVDPDRILQALTNLISNALKFSPAGGTIYLSAHPASAQADETEARFVVHDEGRGIPQDKLESIFERFHQVDASDSRAMGGTGLGLAICRSIILQHGGRIWATSPPGHGAFFHFTLPTRPSSHLR